MSEERGRIHPQEPAEGSEEDEEAPGAEESRDGLGETEEDTEEPLSAHPQVPAVAENMR